MTAKLKKRKAIMMETLKKYKAIGLAIADVFSSYPQCLFA
jgi:hypothetical protein